MPPAAVPCAPSVDVPQVRLPRQVPGPSVSAGDAMCPGCGRAPRFGSAAYGVPPARLDLATASFLRCALLAVVLAGCGGPSLVSGRLALAPERAAANQGG